MKEQSNIDQEIQRLAVSSLNTTTEPSNNLLTLILVEQKKISSKLSYIENFMLTSAQLNKTMTEIHWNPNTNFFWNEGLYEEVKMMFKTGQAYFTEQTSIAQLFKSAMKEDAPIRIQIPKFVSLDVFSNSQTVIRQVNEWFSKMRSESTTAIVALTKHFLNRSDNTSPTKKFPTAQRQGNQFRLEKEFWLESLESELKVSCFPSFEDLSVVIAFKLSSSGIGRWNKVNKRSREDKKQLVNLKLSSKDELLSILPNLTAISWAFYRIEEFVNVLPPKNKPYELFNSCKDILLSFFEVSLKESFDFTSLPIQESSKKESVKLLTVLVSSVILEKGENRINELANLFLNYYNNSIEQTDSVWSLHADTIISPSGEDKTSQKRTKTAHVRSENINNDEEKEVTED